MTIYQLMHWQSKQVITTGTYTPQLNNIYTWPNQIAYLVDMRTNEIIEAKGNFNELFGYRKEEMKTVPDLYDPIVKRHLSEVVNCKRIALEWAFRDAKSEISNSLVQYEYCIQHRTGKVKRIMKQATLLCQPNGNPSHSIAVMTDISHIDSRSEIAMRGYGPMSHLLDTHIPEVTEYKNHLSTREIEILKLVARAKSSSDIASNLCISKHTVDTHRRNMIRKLDVSNSIELINLAKELNLL